MFREVAVLRDPIEAQGHRAEETVPCKEALHALRAWASLRGGDLCIEDEKQKGPQNECERGFSVRHLIEPLNGLLKVEGHPDGSPFRRPGLDQTGIMMWLVCIRFNVNGHRDHVDVKAILRFSKAVR